MLDVRSLSCDTNAVTDALAQPVVVALKDAAARRVPLTPQDLAALERGVRLQLERHIAALRSVEAALNDQRAAERLRWNAIDLPQAMRAAVHRDRHDSAVEAAS